MSETKPVTPHEVLTERVGKISEFKDRDKIHPGVQRYLDSLPAEYKQPRLIAVSDLEKAGDELLAGHTDGLNAAKLNMGAKISTPLDGFHKYHLLKTSGEVEAEMRRALSGEGKIAGHYMNDPRYSAEIKAQFANVLPKDQTVTVERINEAANKIEAAVKSASTPEAVVGAFKQELHAVHKEQLAKVKITVAPGTTPSGTSAPGTAAADSAKTKVNKLIDETLDAKAKQHADQLKKSFGKVFGEIKDVQFDEAKVKDAITKFSQEAIKEGDEAQKALKEGKLHETFLNEVKGAVTFGTFEEKKIVDAITAEKDNVSKILGRNILQRLVGFSDHYSPKAILEDAKTIDGKRGTTRLAMRAVGGATGVGLIISGLGEFKGREANDNSGQIEAHPVAGLIKTVGGSGLVALSALYRGMGRGGIAA